MNRFMGCIAAGLLSTAAIAGAQTGSDAKGHKPDHQMMQMNENQFVAMMLQHHQDGIEMARIAEQKAATPEVKALAKKIREGQERESREMKPFASGSPETPRGTTGQAQHQGHSQDHQAHMQESKKAIERVRTATGKAVDQAFLDEMTKHHQMAIQMTQHTTFETQRLKGMAEKMSASQKREIDEMNRTRQKVS
jgi:uncharacterized protein (DUF305 family)